MAFDGTGWQRAYAAAIERLAFEAAAKCVHAYDPDTYIDAVAASIFHPDVKTEIVGIFMKNIRDFINKELDLGLEIEMTRYGGAYARGGAVYGRVKPHVSDAEIVERIRRLMVFRCGGVPTFAIDFEGRFLIEWLLECIEVADSGDVDHYPEGDCALAIAERLQESGVVLGCLRKALRQDELNRRLSDPVAVAFEQKHRARKQYF
ncbi:hypothetical protein [Bradyrhizobium japonicum]|uniref:hypothetical protein n=1 Tax=Bradyrhizobium japonicum TaxID=375 RepID=UPI0027150D41|nr:hypothetical protein [Bradyrhizobium japonicum]WLB54837.1 hypothetical protein QIH94_02265 [Bradyrhizobium japonicum]WLB63288.1 hypothetical protein QIH96_43620 [Bradyrhizobium japonicum]